MAKHFIDFDRLEVLSFNDKSVSIDDKAHKLGEEHGEFLQALLKFKGAKNVSASANDATKEHLLEELCDVLNVAIDLINSLDYSDEEVEAMFNKKLDKWSSKQEKYIDKN